LRRWLARLREREPARLFPGRAVTMALAGLQAALAACGLVLGWASVSAVLRYGGDHPVNVWDFLLGFVGVQILLVVLLLASFFLPVAALGAPILGVFRGLFGAFYPRLAARTLTAPERTEEWRALWHRLRSRRSLYHRIEPWVLLGLTQAFGVAFNVGALVGLARLVVFSDVAFSWSTTLVDLDARRFHGLVGALATPFGWALPDAAPSLALVEATRYSRLEGAYLLSGAGRAARPELVGGWWPFLAASLAFYGLLPRVLVLGLARLRRAHLLSRLPLDDVEVSRLVRRLAEPHVETASPAPEAPGPSEPPAAPAAHEPPAGTRCAVVLWRDLPPGPEIEAAVRSQMGCEVAWVHAAGGLAFEEGGRDWGAGLDGADHVVVVAEGWESPDRSVMRLLAELRRAGGPRRHVRVLLVDEAGQGVRPPPEGQVRVWRDALARLADPYLAVEPLRGRP
ncbi:MAG TPA: DUF2868 domain-containing protein, partial [Anaeromyxobacter sp.]